MAHSGSGITVHTDSLRGYARHCQRSADQVRHPVRSSLDHGTVIPPATWHGGAMTTLLQLQGSLDKMSQVYERARTTILGDLADIAHGLEGSAARLRESADAYDQADQGARDGLPSWP